MIKEIQRKLEDEDVFIQIFPNEEGITICVCDNKCDTHEEYKIKNNESFIKKFEEIIYK